METKSPQIDRSLSAFYYISVIDMHFPINTKNLIQSGIDANIYKRLISALEEWSDTKISGSDVGINVLPNKTAKCFSAKFRVFCESDIRLNQ